MIRRNSASREARAIRGRSRRGWRRVLWLCGVRTPGMRRADAVAARWERGAAGEAATVRLLRRLDGPWWLSWLVRAVGRGWRIRHDLQLRGRRFNVDHVLVSPCGTAVVVADTKSWHRGRPTLLIGGRVHCGDPRQGAGDDRHHQVEAVARYAHLVRAALGAPTVAVVPLVIVHGSPVAPGGLEAPVSGGTVWVLGAGEVVPRLQQAVQALPDRGRAQALDARVKAVLSPYG